MTTQSDTLGWVPEDSFGARLALVRQRYGWNVKEAAEVCQIPPQSWRRWERDHRLPRGYVQVCETIAAATGASYDWLLDGRHFPGPRNHPIDGYDGISTTEKITFRNGPVASSVSSRAA